MRKFACLLLLLALAAGGGWFLTRDWADRTQAQAQGVREELAAAGEALAADLSLWENAAAEEALAYRPADPDREGTYEFTSPEGIRFISYSKAWDEAGLEELYRELLRNRHGEELYTLERVTVYAEADETAEATHTNTARETPFAPHFPLFDGSPLFYFTQQTGQIALYDGDGKTTVLQMADDLSHEYGHHYTMTYMIEGVNRDADTEYYRLRGGDDRIRLSYTDRNAYLEHHDWFLMELAAEDYVALMGSPNAMLELGQYRDIRGYAQGKEEDTVLLRNACPQSNMFLPYATRVPGLGDYFYSFLGEKAPDYPQTGDIHLELDRHTDSYNLTTGYRTFVSYRVTWDKTLGEDAVYTLVCLYPEEEIVLPLATVRAGERAQAEIGEITYSDGDRVTWYTDEITRGTKQFLVVVTLPDGRVAVSDPVEKTF